MRAKPPSTKSINNAPTRLPVYEATMLLFRYLDAKSTDCDDLGLGTQVRLTLRLGRPKRKLEAASCDFSCRAQFDDERVFMLRLPAHRIEGNPSAVCFQNNA
jgi:hypothetical protein